MGGTEVSPDWSEICFLGFWTVGAELAVDPVVGSEPSVIEGPSDALVFWGFGRYIDAPASPATAACPPPSPSTCAPAITASPVTRPTARATPTRASSP